MNTIDQLSPEAELEKMLSAFFKAELPDPFPPCNRVPSPTQAELPMPATRKPTGVTRDRRFTLSKSRLSLAASVAILLGGCWYLSGQIGQPTERPTAGKGDGSAKIPKELLKATDETKKTSMP